MNALMESPPVLRPWQSARMEVCDTTLDARHCPFLSNTLTSSSHSPSVSGI